MENIDFATLFQGFGTMMESGWLLSSARVFLIALGLLLIYLGWKGVLEPMVMIPMGLGMVAINCGTLFMPDGTLGNLFLDPMLSDTDDLMNTMQIDFLQPVYTLTFSNGLIACFVFMGIGTLLDVGFLPLIFPNNVFDLGVIYFAFFSYLTTSLIGYFANYKQTLLGADQKNYVVTAYFQSAVLIKTCLQMGLVYYTGNYYLWISLELLLGIVYSIILNWKVNQVYPWLKSEVKQGKLLFKKYPEVTRYTKQLFVHKLGSFVQFQTTPFLVYAFVSLKTVAYYGNYTLIIDKISIFISNLLGSTNAGVGNLIAEGDSKRIQQVFWELMGIRFLIAGTISFALIRLTGAFISLWLGSEYVLPQHILYLIIINSFISYTRGAIDQFTYGYGLFQDTWAPIAEVIINLTVAIIAGHFWGLPGILMGNITSLFLIIVIWKPYFLYSQGFKIPVLHYWMGYIKHLLIILLPGIVCYHLYPSNDFTPESSFTHWILYGMILISTYGILTCSLLYLFTPGIRAFAHRILKRHH